MNEKISISNVDKARITEMFTFYLNPANRFSVNGKGEVSFKEKSWFANLFGKSGDNRYDFTEVVRLLTDKIMDVKGKIPYVAQLCGASLGEVLLTNNRPEIIKALFVAYLVDAQPEMVRQQKIPIGQEVTVQQKNIQVPVNYGNNNIFSRSEAEQNRQLRRDVTTLLNNADQVYIVEKD